jgi:ferredoxin
LTERAILPIVRSVSLYITEECINCGACDETCPTGAIGEDPVTAIRFIDQDRCTECVGFYARTMCQVECPVECCVVNPEREESEELLRDKAFALFPDHEFASPMPSHFPK